MAYSATVYRVMTASPSDVSGERAIVRAVLAEWNVVNADRRRVVLLPVSWDTHATPTMGDRPQAIINRQILRDCDLLIGVFWTRIGTPTDDYVSGTVEEIEEHIKAGRPVMLYFSSQPVRLDSVDHDQCAELTRFKDSCKTRGIFETYSDITDFQSKLYRQLQIKLNQDDYFKQKAGEAEILRSPDAISATGIPQLSKETRLLLKEASHDPRGAILRIHTMQGFSVHTNKKEYVEEVSPRAEAKWESAIHELEETGLIKDRGHKREVFALTQRGYEVADTVSP